MAAVLAPAECRACAQPLLHADAAGVCDRCLAALEADWSVLCTRCGERLEIEDISPHAHVVPGGSLCHGCREEAPPYVRAASFGTYDGMLRTLIRLYKFEGLLHLAEPLGIQLAPVLLQTAERLPEGDVQVVPVPLYQGRRAYNQSALITTAALRHVAHRNAGHRFVRSDGALVRTRATASQSQLSPRQRRENVRGAFAAAQDVKGWRVMLVDDVYTTGETVKECTRTLLRAGAAEVYVVTLARAQPDRIARWQP